MTSKNKCIRCNKEITKAGHCKDCWDWIAEDRIRLIGENTWLRKILKGIMETARVVEE